MHRMIEAKRPEIAALCRRYRVRRLEVFGSAARGDDFDPERSDADFLVEFEPESGLPPLEQYVGLAVALEDLLGRPVGQPQLSPPPRRPGGSRTAVWLICSKETCP